jgi:hypothetical protein
MPDYNAISWLPLTAGLSTLGLLLSWLAWRRRDAAAGLRGVSLALLPVAAYLTGVLQLGWRIVTAVVDWVLNVAFSPVVWLGVVLAGISVVLFAVSGRLAAKRPAVEPRGERRRLRRETKPAATAVHGGGRRPPASAPDDDFGEIESILRKRGIS